MSAGGAREQHDLVGAVPLSRQGAVPVADQHAWGGRRSAHSAAREDKSQTDGESNKAKSPD